MTTTDFTSDSYAIGFTNRYFTLWSYELQPLYSTLMTANGEQHYKSGERHVFRYIKNISMDEATARAKYPDLTVNPELRGKQREHSWSTGYSGRTEWSPELLHRGRHQAASIADFQDASYLAWFADEYKGSNPERDRLIERRLHELKWFKYQDYVWMPEAKYNELVQREQAKQDLLAQFADGGQLTIQFERNLDPVGCYKYNGVQVFFPDIKKMSYRGFTYALPEVKGRGKKIKGKSLTLTVKTGNYERVNDYGDVDTGQALIVQAFSLA